MNVCVLLLAFRENPAKYYGNKRRINHNLMQHYDAKPRESNFENTG